MSLRAEMMGPIEWDLLPGCIVAFGDSGVQVRCGSGHHLFWLSLPRMEALNVLPMVQHIAGRHELVNTDLD